MPFDSFSPFYISFWFYFCIVILASWTPIKLYILTLSFKRNSTQLSEPNSFLTSYHFYKIPKGCMFFRGGFWCSVSSINFAIVNLVLLKKSISLQLLRVKKKKKKNRYFKEIFRKMRLVKLNLTISSEKSKETNFYCYRHDSFTNEISIVINFSNSIQKCICGLLHIFREETTFSLKSSVVI